MGTLQLAAVLCSHSVVKVVPFCKITEVTHEWLFEPDPVDYCLGSLSAEVIESICKNKNFYFIYMCVCV